MYCDRCIDAHVQSLACGSIHNCRGGHVLFAGDVCWLLQTLAISIESFT